MRMRRGRGRGPQLPRLKVAATVVSASCGGVWPRASTAMPRRCRNKVKYATWGSFWQKQAKSTLLKKLQAMKRLPVLLNLSKTHSSQMQAACS